MINIAMVTGLLPVVGVPLPLISYGGTAMLTVLFGFGLMLGAIPRFPVDPDSAAWTKLIHCRVEASMAKPSKLLAVSWWQVTTAREAVEEALNAVAQGADARSRLRSSSLSRPRIAADLPREDQHPITPHHVGEFPFGRDVQVA